MDTRDDKLATTRGSYAKFSHEFAGLGGHAKFYKAEAEGQLSRPILDGVVRV
jgi:outer membrane protein insertion porin family